MGSPVSAVIANIHIEEFEEQAIAKATYKPKIWKWYVDDTFTVSDQEHVNSFLQHLNSQQPTIHFTMEIEKDNTITFHDTTVTRDSDSLLTTTVYRKPNHTNQYLAYDSHHLQSVKCGIVKCLYQWAKHLTMKLSVTSKEKKHLSYNTCFWWLSFFICMKTRKDNKGNSSSPLHRGCIWGSSLLPTTSRHNWTIFKSDTTLRSHLVRPKDALEPSKQEGAIYKIPCECGKVYISKTRRSMYKG